MTEELIAQLSRMDPSRLGVIARTSAMQFKKTTKRADGIGSELGVSYLVEGSVRTTGTRIRIAAQLIEAQSETHLWADQYEPGAIRRSPRRTSTICAAGITGGRTPRTDFRKQRSISAERSSWTLRTHLPT